MNWQPIETAPKGKWVLGYIPQAEWHNDIVRSHVYHPFFAPIYFSHEWELMESFGSTVEIHPTHWMPLSEPPK